MIATMLMTAMVTAAPIDVKPMVEKAKAYLASRQNEDGSFQPRLGGPGITALVAAGLIRNGYADDPVVKKALAYLESNVQPDGGVYSRGLANYSTCVAVMAFQDANKDGRYDKVLANAGKFLKTLQFDHGDEKDLRLGGVGYNGNSAKDRPDLSNTHYFLDALLAAGVPKDDPAIKKALVFVSRCQNLPGETNDQPFAQKASADDKGGFVYNPAAGGEAKDGESTPQGGLRSAGVMTYAGLKSFLYAGVTKDDPRVKAALDWIARHYTLDENPGQKLAGLYSYYHTFAKAMTALGEPTFTDAQGTKHDWKAELVAALKKRQQDDGSWTNSNRQFLENTPELATAYSLLALSYAGR